MKADRLEAYPTQPRRSLHSAANCSGVDRTLARRRLPGVAAPVRLLEVELPQANRFRRHLDQLIFLDVFEGQLQRQLSRRLEDDALVGRGRADIGQLLLPADIHRQVVVSAVLANDLTLVHRLAGADEENPALLEV